MGCSYIQSRSCFRYDGGCTSFYSRGFFFLSYYFLSRGFSFLAFRDVFIYFVQSTGTFIAASRFAGATPPPAHVLSRSIGFQVSTHFTFYPNKLICTKLYDYQISHNPFHLKGIGQLLDGTFGSIVGNTASV